MARESPTKGTALCTAAAGVGVQGMANLGNTGVRREVRTNRLGTTLGETCFRRGVENEAPLRTNRILGMGRREDVTHKKLHERARQRVRVELKEGCTRSEVVLLLPPDASAEHWR